jgi:hypothetical protein
MIYMQASDFLQLAATFLEIIIAGFATLIAVQKKRTFGWFIAATFLLFAIFDITRIFAFGLSVDLYALVFLVACATMLYAIWTMLQEL